MANQVNTETKIPAIPGPLMEVTTSLAENLAQSEPYLRFKAADEKFSADHDAQRLLTEMSELQQKIRKGQYNGEASQRDLMRLRELQNAVRANRTIQEFGTAQAEAVAFLRIVNEQISQLIGIDFAGLTRRSSGCC